LLDWAGLRGACGVDLDARREGSLERLADCLEANLDFERLAPLLVREPVAAL
jgi:adenosylcobyric acid synthase